MNPWRGLAGLPRASFMIALATFINRAGVMVRPFLVLYLVQRLGFEEASAGWVLSLYGATTLVAAPLSGWLSDRFGPRRVLRVSLVAAAIAITCYPLARSFPAVVAATVLFSLCNEMPRPALMTLVAEVAPDPLRKQAFVLSRLAINFGLSIGPALGGFLAEIDFLWIFWVDAAASLIAALVLLKTPLPAAVRHERPQGSALRVLARDGALLCFFAATVLNAVMFFQHDSTMAYYMTHHLGLRKFDYGLTITVNTLLIVLVEVELNTRLAHWSHRQSLVVGSLLTTAGFGAMVFADTWWTIVGAVVIWTFGEMIAMPAMSALINDLAPANRRGLYMGTLTLAFGAGLTIGPKFGMTLLDRGGPHLLWPVVAGVGLVSTLLYRLLPERRGVEGAAAESDEAAPAAEPSVAVAAMPAAPAAPGEARAAARE